MILNPDKRKRSSLEKKFEKLWLKKWNSIDLIVEQILVPGRKFRSDYLHQKTKTTIEIHGGTFMPRSGHSHANKLDDYEKQNLLLREGYTMLVLGTSQVNDYWVNFIGNYLLKLVNENSK